MAVVFSNPKDEEEHRHLNQFIVHAALDPLEDVALRANTNYLRQVDTYNDWIVSGYITPSSTFS